jgi:hypothetical protein
VCRWNAYPSQILRNNHWRLVIELIQSRINDLDDFHCSQPPRETNTADDDDNGDDIDSDPTYFEQIHMALRQQRQTFEELEQAHSADVAFRRFRIRLSEFLSDSLPSYGISLPNNRRIQLLKDDTVNVYIHSILLPRLTQHHRSLSTVLSKLIMNQPLIGARQRTFCAAARVFTNVHGTMASCCRQSKGPSLVCLFTCSHVLWVEQDIQ